MKYPMSLLLVALLSASHSQAAPSLVADTSLLNYLSNINTASNPEVVAECFNLYLPQLTTIANNYSASYEECITVANAKLTNLTAQAAKNKITYINETTAICSAFQACGNETDTLTSFNCFANAASNDVSEIYQLASEASSAATTLTQGVKNIQADQDICTSTAQHDYVAATAHTYEQLDNCLQNGPSSAATAATTIASTAAASPTVASSSVASTAVAP